MSIFFATHQWNAVAGGSRRDDGGSNNCTLLDKVQRSQPQVSILACSISKPQNLEQLLRTDRSRMLCQDRKGPLEHVQPANLAKSTIRVTLMQASYFLSNYMNDQLRLELERDERINNGEITVTEAIEEAEEWEEREWKKRWSEFPTKLFTALLKYHAIVLVMRLYEFIAEQLVNDVTLDLLTQDTFQTAKRICNCSTPNKSNTNKNTTNAPSNYVVGKEMFSSCRYANFIAYAADYSVHQVILCYGYFIFFNEHQRRRKERRKQQQQKLEEEKSTIDNNATNDDDVLNLDSLSFSLLKRSALLALSRGVAWQFASFGGAVGTIVLPGWGTLLGTNIGDSLSGLCMDGVNMDSPEA